MNDGEQVKPKAHCGVFIEVLAIYSETIHVKAG